MNWKCLLTVLGATLVATSLLAAEEAPLQRIFDGKTFDGWEGDLKIFRIEDGAVVGGNLKSSLKQNEFLTSKKDYSDFELHLKFKLIGKTANGGVQIRSVRVPGSREMSGYQADMGTGYWGRLYDESRRCTILAGPEDGVKFVHLEDWNDYVIRCEGRRIQMWLNGHQTVDYTEPDTSLVQTGKIGLQIHAGEPSETWYKDIEIRELPKTK